MVMGGRDERFQGPGGLWDTSQHAGVQGQRAQRKPQDTAQEGEARHRHDDDHAGNRWALPVPPTSGRVLDYRTLESRTDNT